MREIERAEFLANILAAEMRSFEETYLDGLFYGKDDDMGLYAYYGIVEVADELVKTFRKIM